MKLRIWLENLDRRLAEIERLQARHNVLLEHHERRSIANEEAVSLMRDEIKPVSLHIAVVGAAVKVVAFGGVLVSIAVGVLKLMGRA